MTVISLIFLVTGAVFLITALLLPSLTNTGLALLMSDTSGASMGAAAKPALQALEQAQAAIERARWILGAAAILCALACLAIPLVLRRMIEEPLAQVANSMLSAFGTRRPSFAHTDRQDAIGFLARSAELMYGRLLGISTQDAATRKVSTIALQAEQACAALKTELDKLREHTSQIASAADQSGKAAQASLSTAEATRTQAMDALAQASVALRFAGEEIAGAGGRLGAQATQVAQSGERVNAHFGTAIVKAMEGLMQFEERMGEILSKANPSTALEERWTQLTATVEKNMTALTGDMQAAMEATREAAAKMTPREEWRMLLAVMSKVQADCTQLGLTLDEFSKGTQASQSHIHSELATLTRHNAALASSASHTQSVIASLSSLIEERTGLQGERDSVRQMVVSFGVLMKQLTRYSEEFEALLHKQSRAQSWSKAA